MPSLQARLRSLRNRLARVFQPVSQFDLEAMGLFDPAYYLAANPDVAAAGVEPFTHYMQYGAGESRNPSGEFQTAYYLSQLPPKRKAPGNPLFHYLKKGYFAGLRPSEEASSLFGVWKWQRRRKSLPFLLQAVRDARLLTRYPAFSPTAYRQLRGSCPPPPRMAGRGVSPEAWDYVLRGVFDNACPGEGITTEELLLQFPELHRLRHENPLAAILRRPPEIPKHPLLSLADTCEEKKIVCLPTPASAVGKGCGWYCLGEKVPEVSPKQAELLRSDAVRAVIWEVVFRARLELPGECLSEAVVRRDNCIFRADASALPPEIWQDRGAFFREIRKLAEGGLVLTVPGQGDAALCLPPSPNLPREQPGSICISVHSFTSGGGEVVPIRLANALKEEGLPVWVHCLRCDWDEPVRCLLREDIPVYTTDDAGQLAMLLDTLRPAVVNTHHVFNQVCMAEAFRLMQSPRPRHVAVNHGMYEGTTRDDLFRILRQMEGNVDAWVCVADKNRLPFAGYDPDFPRRIRKISNGMKPPSIAPVSRAALGIPEEAFVFCLVSRAIPEKGWAEATAAVQAAREHTGRDIRLVLVGDGPAREALAENTPAFLTLPGTRSNPCDWYAMADCGLLPSTFIGESAPLAIIECFMAGRPVLATDIGDISQMLGGAGRLLPRIETSIDPDALCRIIGETVTDRAAYAGMQAAVEGRKAFFRMDRVLREYLETFFPESHVAPPAEAPLVSVIVPCYNHAPFLRERLDSIYGQTYQNFRLLLLDDCSTDGSRAILQEYADRYPDKTRCLFNETNSGGVFRQWAKGLEAAEGELCWVAEPDDACAPDFLEGLVPFFDDPEVRLAMGRMDFTGEDGEILPSAWEEYMRGAGPGRWNLPFTEEAGGFVRRVLGVANVIPNVSGCIFRNPRGMALLKDPQWLDMRICGDWIFYLQQLRGGRIAYTPAARSRFRIHDQGTSAGKETYSRPGYYLEHARVAEELSRLYRVPSRLLALNYQRIVRFYRENPPQEPLETLYPEPTITKEGFL